MFSLKQLLGADDRFFELLDAGAMGAKSCVVLFTQSLQEIATRGGALPVGHFVEARRKERAIRLRITTELGQTLITPLEREDIEALSLALYGISKQVEKIAERLSIFPGLMPHAAFARQAALLLQAVDAVVLMVRQLRGGTNIERMREANDSLQRVEGEADKLMLSLLKELYQSTADAKEIFVLQELHEMVEHAVDRCRDAGNIVLQIVLKQS